MEFEKFFLTKPDSVAKIPANPDSQIVAFAYPISDKVYYLRVGLIREIFVGSESIVLAESQGIRHTQRQNNKPVFIWCREGNKEIRRSKIYSVYQSSVEKDEQTLLSWSQTLLPVYLTLRHLDI